MNTLAKIADRPWEIGDRIGRAAQIATTVARLDMELGLVDATGSIQSTVTELLGDVLASPMGPLLMTILETARDRDLFTADGNLSDDDLAAGTDPAWASEAIGVWQQATGIDLDAGIADAVAGLIPTVAWLMRADRERDWSDENGTIEIEPALRAILSDAAVSSYTHAPSVLADRFKVDADALAAYVATGSGDIDTLPDLPTAGELSYHFHGPPRVGEQFETSAVFRAVLFDWEEVWGDKRSWFGGGIEVAAALPIGKAAKFAKAGKVFGHADEAIDLASSQRRIHILDGDAAGGGHRWPGLPGKTSFPSEWNDDQIMHYVTDVATDPRLTPSNLTGTEGSLLTKAGNPARQEVFGLRDGVCIRVVTEPLGEGIITAHPIIGPCLP